jgi:hypothetical protein
VVSVGLELLDELPGSGSADPTADPDNVVPTLSVVLGKTDVEPPAARELNSVPLIDVYPPEDPLVGALVPGPDGLPDGCVGFCVVELPVGNGGWFEDGTTEPVPDAEGASVDDDVEPAVKEPDVSGEELVGTIEPPDTVLPNTVGPSDREEFEAGKGAAVDDSDFSEDTAVEFDSGVGLLAV